MIIKNRPPIKYVAVVDTDEQEEKQVEFDAFPHSHEAIITALKGVIGRQFSLNTLTVVDTNLEF